jgi:predicted transcriptional regulator
MLDGKGDTDIAKQLGVTRQAFYAYKKKARNITQTVQTSVLKGALRLEISQENALSDLADQMKEYTDQYEKAVKDDDMKAAYAWSARRVDLLEKMLKVTGLYEAPTKKQEPLKVIFEIVDGARTDV